MGTTLALVGAYVLAAELARERHTGDHAAAFARYEELLRGYVDSAQGLPPGGARALHPSTRLGVALVHGVHRVAAWEPLRTRAQRLLLTSAKHEPVLPEHRFGAGLTTGRD
jgi:2-polyprenyl-6-methoxyphenol hydroxylase-like FAD-dependent oxidoreductase